MDGYFISLMVFAGTAVFALTGAIKGIAHRLDLLGVVVLGCTVGIGGGVIRDAVLGMTPAAALSDSGYLLVCIVISLIVFLLPRNRLVNHREIIIYADAVGLGLFTAIGNTKAAQLGLPGITVVLSGVITAVGGGMLRDVLVCSVPYVLKYDFYATASLIGGLLYIFLSYTSIAESTLFLLVALIVFLLRITAYHFHLHLPKYKGDTAQKGRQKSRR